MKIGIIGAGYVGLVSGACFSDMGHSVIIYDTDVAKIARLCSGDPVIYEPGLEQLLRDNCAAKRLLFSSDILDVVQTSEIIFIAVGTPQKDNGKVNLDFVKAACTELASSMYNNVNDKIIVAIKSTVPVGTGAMAEGIFSSCGEKQVSVVSNPEFLKEGAAIEDFMRPDRVVIGADDAFARDTMESLYKSFVRTGKPILVMDKKSAELTKYASNGMLATKISFMNEIANLCDEVGVNVDMVREGIGTDSRIGPHFLFPGIGYGGSCFPKDVRALISTASEHGMSLNILSKVDSVNREQKGVLVRKILDRFGRVEGKTLGMWGIAFKPNTDDIRESPALEIIKWLLDLGAKMKIFDPVALSNVKGTLGEDVENIEYCNNMYNCCLDVDALIVATEWRAFRYPDFARVKRRMRTPIIFDGRNIYSRADLEGFGFEYFGIGRGKK